MINGDRRPYRLHYFLENDTIEVLEVRPTLKALPVCLKDGGGGGHSGRLI